MKKALVIDIDGTAWRDCLEVRLAKLLLDRKLIDPERYTEPLRLERERRLRRVSHQVMLDAWVRANNTNGFAGVRTEDMRRAAIDLVNEDGDEMYVWTRELIAACASHGYRLVAISGSSEDAVKPFCERLGFDVAIGSIYPTADGAHIPGPAKWMAEKKGDVMRGILAEFGITMDDEVIAIGDTRADYSMLQLVRYPIAFEPSGDLLHLLEDAPRVERSFAIVRDSKDGITTTVVMHDARGAYERSCGLEDFLPDEIARDLRRRIGHLLRFPAARLPRT